MKHIMNEGELTALSELNEILAAFPDVSHAFGYGSGVFEQRVAENTTVSSLSSATDTATDTDHLPMIDLILSSSDVQKWHDDNLKMNRFHYALMPRILGPSFITSVQHAGAGVYFNPMVSVEYPGSKRLVKYGVIDDERLKDDLMQWDSMYIAGRMHKPIAHLEKCDEIMHLQETYNLKYALATALLLGSWSLNGSVEDVEEGGRVMEVSDIFETIAGLSYMGDPRMAAGAEDPMKVKKLVHSKGQLERFHTLYMGQIKELETLGLLTMNTSSSKIEMDLLDRSTRRTLFGRLPPKLLTESREQFTYSSQDSRPLELNEIKLSCEFLQGGLKRIVGPPAKIQSAKGLISAGLYKSVAYASAKLAKGALKGIL